MRLSSICDVEQTATCNLSTDKVAKSDVKEQWHQKGKYLH